MSTLTREQASERAVPAERPAYGTWIKYGLVYALLIAVAFFMLFPFI